MNSAPFFSVIIPIFERHALLKRTLNSIQAQTYPDYECLLIEDGSQKPYFTDQKDVLNFFNSPSTEKDTSPLPVFRYFYHRKNRGVSYARNFGINKARGKWICFLDSDDEWKSSKLSKAYQFITQHQHDFKIFQTEETWIRNHNQVTPPRKHLKQAGDLFQASLIKCSITPSSVVIHHSLFQQGFYFNRQLPTCEDYDLWIRISSCFPVYLLREKLTIRHQGHQNQLSFRYPMMDRYRLMAIRNFILHGPNRSQQKIKLATIEMKKKEHILTQGMIKRKKILSLIDFFLKLIIWKIRKIFFNLKTKLSTKKKLISLRNRIEH